MNSIFGNFVSDMTGPQFLQFYILAIGVAAVLTWALRSQWGSSITKVSLKQHWQPYELCFMRRGARETIGLIIYNLLESKYLIKEGNEVKYNPKAPKNKELTAVEQKVYDHFGRTRHRIKDVIKDKDLQKEIKDHYRSLGEDLISKKIFFSEEARWFMRILTYLILFAILGIGLYKFLLAIEKGKTNVGFLIALSVVAFLILPVIGRLPRLTPIGRQFFKDLETAHEPLKNSEGLDQQSLYLAVFGMAMLSDFGALDLVNQELQKYGNSHSASSWIGDSGGGCGGGCSSCGGGCGGCGGCGG